jgi:predicted nucleic acid-binding Zn ribbon protein
MAFCTECGANVPEDLKFCTECGAAMGAAKAAAPAPAAEAVRQTAPTPQQQQPPPQPPQTQPQQSSPQPIRYPPPAQPAYGFDGEPPKGGAYAVMGVGAYIGTMILFCVPVIGWLACIIMSFAAKNRNRRNFARAMLVFLIIGIVLSVALYFVFSWVWGAAAEYLQQYINEATGGAVDDLGGLGDLGGLLDILKELPSQ